MGLVQPAAGHPLTLEEIASCAARPATGAIVVLLTTKPVQLCGIECSRCLISERVSSQKSGSAILSSAQLLPSLLLGLWRAATLLE
jgi:hypothetical protein